MDKSGPLWQDRIFWSRCPLNFGWWKMVGLKMMSGFLSEYYRSALCIPGAGDSLDQSFGRLGH